MRFDPATKASVLERDGRCVVAVACQGQWRPLTVNHIVNRGSGGSRNPAIGAVTNGIACCEECNSWLEDHPLVAYAHGWKRRRSCLPGPVRYPDGLWYVLLPDGTRTLTEETA